MEVMDTLVECMLETASPGAAGIYDPDKPIEAKRHSYFYYGDEEEDCNDGLPVMKSVWDD